MSLRTCLWYKTKWIPWQKCCVDAEIHQIIQILGPYWSQSKFGKYYAWNWSKALSHAFGREEEGTVLCSIVARLTRNLCEFILSRGQSWPGLILSWRLIMKYFLPSFSSLPQRSIEEGFVSVTSKSKWTKYWLTACSSLPKKKSTDHLDMTIAVYWGVKQETNNNNSHSLAACIYRQIFPFPL